MNIRHRQTCRVCSNPNLVEVIDLGGQFLQGAFCKKGLPSPSLRKIPTKLVRCDTSKNENACGLVQMSVTTPPEILYSNYWYKSGVSNTMRKHLLSVVESCLSLVPNPSHVIDLAANDGTLLSNYPNDIKKIAVDPSDIARSIKIQNCEVINDLFPNKYLSSKKIKFDIVTTIAMFYDIENPVEFVRKIKEILSPDGIWVFEVAYLPKTLKQTSYDTIVGEHISYFSLSSLEYIAKMAGLKIFRVEENDINGGTIRCYCCHEECFVFDQHENRNMINQMRQLEFDMELDTDKPYESFRSRVKVVSEELVSLLKRIKADGKTIHLYGASTKINTVLQYCGIDERVISYAAERSEEKFGAMTLGTNIPIISEKDSLAKSPDYYLVGPWHFKNEILERESENIKNGIKYIFPLPKLEIY